jgi:type II secretory pathway predicted ATPase ExeA
MTRLEKHIRTLKDGTQKIYRYAVGTDGERHSLNEGTVSTACYRSAEKRRIVAALQANSSLLIVGEAGGGKTTLSEFVAEELELLGFTVVTVKPSTAKQMVVAIALQLGVDAESLEGKALTAMQLMQAIADHLQDNLAFLICDDAHRLQVQVRCWLERLHELGQPLLLLATHPPARDIFLKLPRIELEPLGDRTIRQIMKEAATELELELSTAQLAHLQQRAGGNPMLAARVIREEYLGLDDPSPDHRQWIDGTPLLIAGLMTFTILRFIGLGLNSTSLYLFGGILAVAVGIFRLILYSLPRKSGRLGQ